MDDAADLEGELRVEPPFKVTPQTAKMYQSNLRSLINYSERLRASEDDAEPVALTLTDLVTDFLARDDLTLQTQRNYRSALLWHARSRGSASKASRAVVSEAAKMIALLEETRSRAGRPKGEEAAPKTIPEADYQDLVAELQRRAVLGSAWADRACTWAMAAMASGVRPHEWVGTHWDPKDPMQLRVPTGKMKITPPAFTRKHMSQEERAVLREAAPVGAAVVREVPIDTRFQHETVDAHLRCLRTWLESWRAQRETRGPGRPSRKRLDDSQIVPVEQLSDNEIEEGYTAYYNGARNAIRMACQTLWAGEKFYSLYSMRRQFSANSRAQHGPERTAQIMGHTSPDTPAAAYYGKQGAAHSRYRTLGAERIGREGSAMPQELREELANRRGGPQNDGLDNFEEAQK